MPDPRDLLLRTVDCLGWTLNVGSIGGEQTVDPGEAELLDSDGARIGDVTLSPARTWRASFRLPSGDVVSDESLERLRCLDWLLAVAVTFRGVARLVDWAVDVPFDAGRDTVAFHVVPSILTGNESEERLRVGPIRGGRWGVTEAGRPGVEPYSDWLTAVTEFAARAAVQSGVALVPPPAPIRGADEPVDLEQLERARLAIEDLDDL